jgi:hypothetical protein
MIENFKADLEFGEKYQGELLKYVGVYEKHEMAEGYFKEYDLKIYKKKGIELIEKTYEVKADRFGCKTGNIAIEYMSSNKPSGITTTQANYWAIFLVNKDEYELYIIPTKRIRSKIENKQFKRDLKLAGGKNNCYLFDKSIFDKYKIEI